MEIFIFVVLVAIFGIEADQLLNEKNKPALYQTTAKLSCKDLCKQFHQVNNLTESTSGLECDLVNETRCPTTRVFMILPLANMKVKHLRNGCLTTILPSANVVQPKVTTSSERTTVSSINGVEDTASTTKNPFMTFGIINETNINSPPEYNESFSKCIYECPTTLESNPVCGTNNETYDNISKLRCAQSCGVDLDLLQNSSCPTSSLEDGRNDKVSTSVPNTTISSTTTSSIPRTTFSISYIRCTKTCFTGSDYGPVCGTDLQTYVNVARIDCARNCGRDIAVLCNAACPLCDESNMINATMPTPRNHE